MRRILLCALAGVAVLAVGPSTALARKHHRHHRKHHVRVHHKRFGTLTASSSTGSAQSSDTAGTVSSFDGTTLVIKLTDNSTVSGKVTPDTEIDCQSAQQSFQGDEGTSGGSGDQGDQSGDQGGPSGGGNDQGDQGDDDNGDGDNGDGGQSCGTANLTPGAVVLGAELKISSAGATWSQVELMS